jgi:phosphoglycolate phosphatase-like HAD superfamily hydrolase
MTRCAAGPQRGPITSEALKLALDLDAVLGDTAPLWRAWLEDAARRYRSIAELDPASLPSDRAEAADRLDRWAQAGIGDWRAALERFAEDRAPAFLRPDGRVSEALRRLQATGARLGTFTDAPEPLARIALATLGAARRLEAAESGRDAQARLLERLGPGTRVVHSREELIGLAP